MKTHDIAKALTVLAQVLRSAPNQPIEDFGVRSIEPSVNAEVVPVALSTLVALSAFDKRQWHLLIEEYDMPIEIRPRDASRDILGKILKYLEQNPSARRDLAQTATSQRSQTSPELMRALQALLKT